MQGQPDFEDTETEVDTDDEDSGVPQTESETDYESDSSTTSELLLPVESNNVFVNDAPRPVSRDVSKPFKPAFGKLIKDTFNVSLRFLLFKTKKTVMF